MRDRGSSHETLGREHVGPRGSDRSFALVFAAVFALLGAAPAAWREPVRWWALAVAAGFAVVGLVAPALLKPLNDLWHRFGLLLARLVNPIVMAVLFYGVVTPTALLMRLFRKDPLALRFDPDAETYWTPRRPPGPAPDSLRNPF